MRTFEVEGLFPFFRYKVEFGTENALWVLRNIQLFYKGKPLLPMRRLHRAFATENSMIEQSLAWCDAIAKHMMISDIPEPGMPREWEISVDQVLQRILASAG